MSTPTPRYDAWQTAFYWSWLSNDASQHDVLVPLDHSQKWPQCLEKAREQATRIFTERLTDKVRQALQQGQELIGDDWHAVWGPVVYVKGARPLVTPFSAQATFEATNAMLVVHSARQQRYIVAIAGTNPHSAYDWLREDFTLTPGYDWQSALKHWQSGAALASGNPALATLDNGTFTGVSQLLAMRDAGGRGLLSFLQGVNASGCTLTVAGHSLGGALSPTLALALVDPEHPLQNNWQADQLRVYATAGATPGNAALAQRYRNTLPASIGDSASPWQVWNAVVWNQFDVVPRAWALSTLDALPGLYAQASYQGKKAYGDVQLAEIWALVKMAQVKAGLFELENGLCTHLDSAQISGILNPDATPDTGFAWNAGTSSAPVWLTPAQMQAGQSATPIAWADQVLYQHIHTYTELVLGTSPEVAQNQG